MTTHSSQKVVPLTEGCQQRLEARRAVVEELLADDRSREKYRKPAGKLGAIKAILEAGVFDPNQTYEIQCLGTVLGDALAQELSMEWVTVEDGNREATALHLPGTSIVVFPLTMISKRLQRGAQVDIFDLFNRVAARIDELRRAGR